MPGIGPVTAAALIAWMSELGAIGNRQAAALIGVAPFARDSGTLKGGRHISGGRRWPRDVLYMAAMAACIYNPEMAEFYGRMKEMGKPHKVAVTAVMRKLIVTANALLRDRRAWEVRTEGRRQLTPVRAASRGGPRGTKRIRRPDHDTVAGRSWHARMAPACGQECGKPGSGSQKTAEKVRIRGRLQTWMLSPERDSPLREVYGGMEKRQSRARDITQTLMHTLKKIRAFKIG